MMPRLAATESSQASALAGQCAFGPSVVSIEVEHDADHDDQRQRQRDRFPQHRAQRRREYLSEGIDGVVEHFRLCRMAEVATPGGEHKWQ
jgi:hypothetical protein